MSACGSSVWERVTQVRYMFNRDVKIIYLVLSMFKLNYKNFALITYLLGFIFIYVCD